MVRVSKEDLCQSENSVEFFSVLRMARFALSFFLSKPGT